MKFNPNRIFKNKFTGFAYYDDQGELIPIHEQDQIKFRYNRIERDNAIAGIVRFNKFLDQYVVEDDIREVKLSDLMEDYTDGYCNIESDRESIFKVI